MVLGSSFQDVRRMNMETKFMTYDVDRSAQRIDDILNASNSSFSDADEIPSRDRLTFTNGYYVNVTVRHWPKCIALFCPNV